MLDVIHCIRLHTLLHVVAQSLKPVKLLHWQLPTFLLFCECWGVVQQCWIHLHSSSNIVRDTHAHCTWSPKSYGLWPSHNALQVPTLLGVVASVCTALPTLLAKQCWELLHSFTCSLTKASTVLDCKTTLLEFWFFLAMRWSSHDSNSLKRWYFFFVKFPVVNALKRAKRFCLSPILSNFF